jgi:16S rRNA (guanine527-N7)-methyltransferase
MTASSSQVKAFREALSSEAGIYQARLSAETIERLSEYYDLLSTWNARLHLVAPCPPHQFATRHVLESLMLLPHLPQGAKVADIGSGAGLPIIPCLIARPDITATLIESSKKKAVFLREALNRAAVSKSATVIAKRFEEIPAPEVDFITCRALDRFDAKLPSLLKWSPPASMLLFFGGEGLREQIVHMALRFTEIQIPNSKKRYLFVIRGK